MDVSLDYSQISKTGALISKIATAASTNATSVKPGEGRVIGWTLTNTTAAFKYFRLFNLATAPTVGTNSPTYIVGIPPNSTINRTDDGDSFGTGIAYAITGAVADLDATVTAANDVIGALYYV